jgi:glutathione peroxidase
MTGRQIILKTLYPLFSIYNYLTGRGTHIRVDKLKLSPPESIYSILFRLNDGSDFSFSSWKGKKILVVNTASNCGYTPQYDELQELSEMYEGRLYVIGFPANDFKEQEKGNDEEIAAFCKLHYGVCFPLASKSMVIPGPEQNPVFQWLTQKEKNGWNDSPPSWNFSKYLIDENGRLACCIEPSVSPVSRELIAIIET